MAVVQQLERALTLMAGLRASSVLVLVLLAGSLACDGATDEPEESLLTVSISPFGDTTVTTEPLIGEGQLHFPGDAGVEGVAFFWSWKVDRDGLGKVDEGITTKVVTAARTRKGEVWEVTVRADYGHGIAGPETAEVLIINTPPKTVCQNVYHLVGGNKVIKRNQPIGVVLRITVTVIDPDEGDPADLSYEWLRTRKDPITEKNVQIVIGGDEETLNTSDSEVFEVGDVINIRMTASDDEDTNRKSDNTKKPACTVVLQASGALSSTGLDSSSSSSSSALDGAVVGGPAQASSIMISQPSSVPISISELNVCSIAADGTLQCSGDEESGVTNPPAGRFSQVAVQLDYACAILADDQSIHCWGAPLADLGQLDPPEGSFSQIDLGIEAACGLRASGEVACWGDDSLGQASPPEGQFLHLDVSDTYGCAIDAEDVVSCWGALE